MSEVRAPDLYRGPLLQNLEVSTSRQDSSAMATVGSQPLNTGCSFQIAKGLAALVHLLV